MPAKKPASDKVFDVANPGATKPDIGSKPMIVGHKSMASDPMMREKDNAAEESNAPSEPVKKPVSKITISPIVESSEEKDAASSDPEAKPVEMPDKPPAEPAEGIKDAAGVIDESAEKPKSNSLDANDSEGENEVAVDEDVEKIEEDSAVSASDTSVSDVKKEANKKEEQALDPTAVALERDENLKKLIESKKYRVAIKETKDHTGNRPVIFALLAVIAGAIGLFTLIDTGMLDVGVKLPFSIFNNDSSVASPSPVVDVAPVPAAAAEEKKADETKTDKTAVTIPDGFVEYRNTTYGYSIWHPITMEPGRNGIGSELPVTEEPSVLLTTIKKETECCIIRIESIIDVQGTNKQLLADLYKQGGVKAVAKESQRINADDTNPNLVNKTVSEITNKKRGNVDTLEYTVSAGFSTGFFEDVISGEVLEKPAVIIFFETSKGVIRIQAEADNTEVDTILATLSS